MSVKTVLSSLILAFYYILESLILKFVPRSFRYKNIKGQIVLITGAGSGLGRQLALSFAKHGAKIVVWDLNLSGAQETVDMVKDHHGEAFAYQCDVSQPQAVYDGAAKVRQEVGKVDILINNAGIVAGRRLMDCPDEKIKKTLEVNTLAHFWTCKAFLPDMMAENKGHIVTIASMFGLCAGVRLTDYCTSKFASVRFEESLRLELRAEGYDAVISSVVCPIGINTGMFDGFNPGFPGFLSTEYAAEDIVSAVLTNQEFITIPGHFTVFYAFKALFPTKMQYIFNSIIGIDHAMDSFRGRQKED